MLMMEKNQFVPYGDCMHTNDTDPEKWWTIDFGNMYTIESVSIYGRKFCCTKRHSDFEIRIHNTSDWNSQYTLCYKQIGQAPTELFVNCTDHISGKYLTVYKKDDYHHYPLTLCEVEVYGTEITGNTVNTYISRPTTLGMPSGDNRIHESRPTTFRTTIRDYITHGSNFSSNTRLKYDIQTTRNINTCLCKCTNSNNYQQAFNSSKGERQFLLTENIERIKEELRIDLSKLSRTIRKTSCAADERRSSKNLGILGIIILLSVTFCIALSDLLDVIRYLNRHPSFRQKNTNSLL
ncbi:unnamed protein product [Mytilus edulis]|uniref:Fucolectin tachylectin-4 pentraxin-1 domain-containing protein n=1 Tax=Mytilus edulis TaxID=6550 RepID=A0A8S3QTV7_MYTED|nr:unnamed protein product [Mytilus edulis]